MRWRIGWLMLFSAIPAVAVVGAARADEAPALPPSRPESTATATGAKAEAQQHFDRGNQLRDARSFEDALAEFRAAYQSFPSPKILYNQAEVECELGLFVAAAEHYDAFLREFSRPESTEDAQRIEAARAALQSARRRIATLELEAASGVDMLIDERVVGKSPLLEPVLLDPGHHRVSFHGAGRADTTREVVLAPGQRLHLADELVAAPESPPPRPFWRRWPYWAVAGAVVLGSVAVTLALTHDGRPPCPASAMGVHVAGCTVGD